MGTNIFQALGQVTGGIAEDMGRRLEAERKQEEAIKASSLLNNIETEASQRLLQDRDLTNIDQTYRDQVLPQWMSQLENKYIGKETNENVLRQVRMGLTNFKGKLSLQAQTIELEQRKIKQQNDFDNISSSMVARINLNPGQEQFEEELLKIKNLTDNLPLDVRDKTYNDFSSAATRAYSMARINQIEEAYQKGGLNSEDVEIELERLNRDVISNEQYYIDQGTRLSLQNTVSDKKVSILKTLKASRKENVTKEFTAYLDNYSKGVVDKNTVLEAKMLATSDDEFDREEIREQIAITDATRPIQVNLKNGHVTEANTALANLKIELDEAVKSGDNTRINLASKVYEAGKLMLAQKVAEVKKSTAEAMKEDPKLQDLKANGDVQGQVDYMARKSAGVVESSRLRLLNDAEVAAFTESLNNAANPQSVKEFARTLYGNYSKVPVTGSQLSAYDLVIQQLVENKSVDKKVATALHYVNRPNFDQILKYTFEAEESKTLTSQDKAKVAKELRKLMAPVYKAYQGFDTAAPNTNPADLQFNLAYHIAMRLPSRAGGINTPSEAARRAYQMIAEPAQTIVKTNKGSVALSPNSATPQAVDFLKNKDMQKAVITKLINKHGSNGVIYPKSLLESGLWGLLPSQLSDTITTDAALNNAVWRENKGIFTLMVNYNGVEYPLPLYRDKETGVVRNFYITKEELERQYPELKKSTSANPLSGVPQFIQEVLKESIPGSNVIFGGGR